MFKVETGKNHKKPPYQWSIPSYSSIRKLTRSFRLVSYVKIYHRNDPHMAIIFLGNQNLQNLNHGHSKHFVKWYHQPTVFRSIFRWNPGSSFSSSSRALNGPLIFKKAWSAVRPQRKITSLVAATRSVMAFTAKSCITCRTCRSSVGSSLSKNTTEAMCTQNHSQNHPKWKSWKNVLDSVWAHGGEFHIKIPWRGIRYFKDLAVQRFRSNLHKKRVLAGLGMHYLVPSTMLASTRHIVLDDQCEKDLEARQLIDEIQFLHRSRVPRKLQFPSQSWRQQLQ